MHLRKKSHQKQSHRRKSHQKQSRRKRSRRKQNHRILGNYRGESQMHFRHQRNRGEWGMSLPKQSHPRRQNLRQSQWGRDRLRKILQRNLRQNHRRR
jgi:hypothetical protein